nr:uncharacterized protein LOC123287491 [Equus asinus]
MARWVSAKPRHCPGPREPRAETQFPSRGGQPTSFAGTKWDGVAKGFLFLCPGTLSSLLSLLPLGYSPRSAAPSLPPATRRKNLRGCSEGETRGPRRAGEGRASTPNAWKTGPDPGQEGAEREKISWCRDTWRGGAGGGRGESGPKGSGESCGARARANRVAHPTPVPVTWRICISFAVWTGVKPTLPQLSTPNHQRRSKKDFQTCLSRRRVWRAKENRDLDGPASWAGFISSPKCWGSSNQCGRQHLLLCLWQFPSGICSFKPLVNPQPGLVAIEGAPPMKSSLLSDLAVLLSKHDSLFSRLLSAPLHGHPQSPALHLQFLHQNLYNYHRHYSVPFLQVYDCYKGDVTIGKNAVLLFDYRRCLNSIFPGGKMLE